MGSRSSAIRELARKDYIMTVLAAIFFMGINFIFISLVPVYTVESGHSQFLGGFQNTFFSTLCVVFRFHLAPMADRRGRKTMMLVGSAAFVLGPVIVASAAGNYGLILAGRAVMSAGMASFLSAVSCHIAETVPSQRRGLAIGIQRAGYTMALMAGPYFGLEIAEGAWGFRGMFLLTAGIGALAFLMVSSVKDSEIEIQHENNVLKDTVEVIKDRTNLKIYYSLLHLAMAYGVILSYTALYLGRFRELPNPGIYFTYYAVSGLVGSILAGVLADRFSRDALARPLLMAMGAGLGILSTAAWNPVAISLVSGVITGACFTGGIAVLVSWLVDITPAKLRGTTLGLQENCIDGGMALGSLVFGGLIMVLSFQQTYILLGSIAFVVPLFLKTGKKVPQQRESK